MNSIFRKFAEWLGMLKDQREEEDAFIHKSSDENSQTVFQEVEIRTKTLYPRNQPEASFRFPIIPDELPELKTNHAGKEKKTFEKVSVSAPVSKEVRQVNRPEERRVPEKELKRKSFTPSQIVSPVYGKVHSKPNQIEGTAHISRGFNESSIQPKQPKQAVNQKDRFTEMEQANEQPFGAVPEMKIDKAQQSKNDHQDNLLIVEHHREEIQQPKQIAQIISFPGNPAIPKEIADTKEQIDSRQEGTLSQIVERGTWQRVTGPYLSDRTVEETDTIPKETEKIPWVSMDEGRSTTVSSSTSVSAVTFSAATPTASAGPSLSSYALPAMNYLKKEPVIQDNDDSFIHEQIDKLTVALENFNVLAEVVGVVKGPTVTRYELQPAPGVKVNKFTNLIDDIKLALAAKDIRMEAPIPGRSAIGIEVPNEVSSPVFIRSILESEEFRSHPSPLAVSLGRDISGEPVIGDLRKMPHGLIAGATGSGKSVCINSILISLMYKATPTEVRLILVDPKVVELAPYNHIPHLLTPVVTDPKQATAALKWAVEEMDSRYEKFAELGTRDMERYNAVATQEGFEKLPYIVIVIDELADLMMVAPHDVEESICRIAQKARACGIHLLVATQRPSVDVITGLIKANIPTRVAFAVSSQADSRTILDMGGAERLLGKGDMLYYPSGLAKPLRLQGNFVSDEEIENVVEHVKGQQKVNYLFDKEELSRSAQQGTDNEDELFGDALLFVIEQGQASSSSLQRRFRIGYNRAARLIDMMESEGFISGQSGSKPRDVLLSMEDYENLFS